MAEDLLLLALLRVLVLDTLLGNRWIWSWGASCRTKSLFVWCFVMAAGSSWRWRRCLLSSGCPAPLFVRRRRFLWARFRLVPHCSFTPLSGGRDLRSALIVVPLVLVPASLPNAIVLVDSAVDIRVAGCPVLSPCCVLPHLAFLPTLRAVRPPVQVAGPHTDPTVVGGTSSCSAWAENGGGDGQDDDGGCGGGDGVANNDDAGDDDGGGDDDDDDTTMSMTMMMASR